VRIPFVILLSEAIHCGRGIRLGEAALPATADHQHGKESQMPKDRQSQESKKAIRDYKLTIKDEQMKRAIKDGQMGIAREIRLRWLSIFDGLVRAAEDGNVQAYDILREEAWGTPASVAPQKSGGRKPRIRKT
jgi:hypothetical protein